MAYIGLRFYPDEVLLQRAEPVTVFDDQLRKLVVDMFETMYVASGVGLAAPQIGVSKRLFVMDCSRARDGSRRLAIANPEIIYEEGRQNGNEGCLSVPGYSYPVRRANIVVVRGQDMLGQEFEFEGMDYEARCLLHETDHCDGKLYIERLTPLRKRQIIRSIQRRMKANAWPWPLTSSGL